MRFLAVLAAVVLPLVAYYPVYQNREATIRSLDAQIYEVERHIEQALAAQRKLSQFHEEVQKLNVQVATLRRILPANPTVDEIGVVVHKVAQTAGVRLSGFEPRPAIS